MNSAEKFLEDFTAYELNKLKELVKIPTITDEQFNAYSDRIVTLENDVTELKKTVADLQTKLVSVDNVLDTLDALIVPAPAVTEAPAVAPVTEATPTPSAA